MTQYEIFFNEETLSIMLLVVALLFIAVNGFAKSITIAGVGILVCIVTMYVSQNISDATWSGGMVAVSLAIMAFHVLYMWRGVKNF